MTKALDLTGKTFGRLRGRKRVENDRHGRSRWLFDCACGETKVILGSIVVRGDAASCGCLRKEVSAEHIVQYQHLSSGNRRHGHSSSPSPTYVSWHAMKNRCLNPNDPFYHRYGGRGITIHQPWIDSFEAFLADIGERPEGLSLDRIDNDGNYEPGNVRWATPSEQAANRSSSNV